LQLQYPKLYSFARDKCITISKLFSHSHIENLFILPFSAAAFNQLQIVQSFIDHFPLTEQHDCWKSDWGDFSVSKAYKYLMGHRQVHQVYTWLWDCFCQPKHKVFFFWLLLKDRLSTRNILRRKNMALESYNCVFC